MSEFSRSKLFRKLLDNPDMVQEILEAHNIRTRVAPLGKDIAGFVYRSVHGIYYIIGNQILDFEAQRFIFLHELYHIVVEAPTNPYLLRLDWSREEVLADVAAEKVVYGLF